MPGITPRHHRRLSRSRVNSGNDTPLEMGARYLLFLRYDSKSQSYPIVKHWQLADGKVIAVDLYEKRRAIEGNSIFDGKAESQILAATNAAVQTEKTPTMTTLPRP